jgi:membrane associated rhomboid family serine protease
LYQKGDFAPARPEKTKQFFKIFSMIGKGVYLLGGLAGNVLSLALGPDMVSVGASGAIFALFGAVAVYSRRSIGQSIVGALIFGFFLFIISSGPDVNYLAHIGGLVSGLGMGYLLARVRKPRGYHVNSSYITPF